MAWFLLFVAGLVEIAMALALKVSRGWTRLAPSVLAVALALASIFLLARAAREIPAGSAYAIWTGITLPGENWAWSPGEGYRALHPAKRAALVYSSAGAYPLHPDEDPSDFQKPYMRRWLRFLGVEDVYEITVGPTLAPPEQRAHDKVVAMERARAIGRRF